MTITIKNPALFDRLRIQALLAQIARQRGSDDMWDLLEKAIECEGLRQAHEIEHAESD